MRRAAILLALIAATSAAFASAPDVSPRPVARPEMPNLPSAVTAHPGAIVGGDGPPRRIAQQRRGLAASLRPLLRPVSIVRDAQKRRQTLARGAVCGDPAIQGEGIGAVAGKIEGCGVDEAVRVRSIAGVALSQQAVMDCQTARTIKTWMQSGMASAVDGLGGGVAELRVAAHYACRGRNNQKGARISEHGKGHAIDIAGFQLRDGGTISVLGDWGRGKKGRILEEMHSSACGPFGTVLGPGADRFHRDHLHFDTARYRSGSYCR